MFNNTGTQFEKSVSLFFHSSHIPVLVSPVILRERSFGQIDVAWLTKESVFVAECKIREDKLYFQQRKRLFLSLGFLSNLFQKKGTFLLVSQFAKCKSSAYPFNVKKIGELA